MGVMLTWLFATGCTQRTIYEIEVVEEHRMSDAQYLRRLSLDLRGRVPTVEEWAAFDGDAPQDTIRTF